MNAEQQANDYVNEYLHNESVKAIQALQDENEGRGCGCPPCKARKLARANQILRMKFRYDGDYYEIDKHGVIVRTVG